MPHGIIPQLALSSLDFHRHVSSADTDRTGGISEHHERTGGAHTSARHVRCSRLFGLTFKPPARIFGTLLKLVLQFLLLRLENLRIRWRTVIGFAEVVER